MEFVVKIQSEGEQKKFKLISFTHWQFIVSYHKAVANLRLNSAEKLSFWGNNLVENGRSKVNRVNGLKSKWPKVGNPEVKLTISRENARSLEKMNDSKKSGRSTFNTTHIKKDRLL